MEIEAWVRDFITKHRVARLGTVDERGQPHVVPIVYAFAGHYLYTPLDAKPKQVEVYRLRRVRNIQTNPRVTVLIDDYDEDWRRLAWVQIRGVAEVIEVGTHQQQGVALLHEKYSQYTTMPLTNRPLIVITPRQITSWRALPEV
jgi:PPOX class probable F420-dependent enzyme